MTGTQSPLVTAEGLLKDVMAFFDHGEFFRAYDLAAEALELRRAKGLQSEAVREILPHATDEAVHRDGLVLA